MLGQVAGTKPYTFTPGFPFYRVGFSVGPRSRVHRSTGRTPEDLVVRKKDVEIFEIFRETSESPFTIREKGEITNTESSKLCPSSRPTDTGRQEVICKREQNLRVYHHLSGHCFHDGSTLIPFLNGETIPVSPENPPSGN